MINGNIFAGGRDGVPGGLESLSRKPHFPSVQQNGQLVVTLFKSV